MKNNDNGVLTDKKELSAMVSDLSEKEKEFDLRIKGLQQILIDENKKKNILEREITNIKRDVSTLQININSTIKGNKISLGQIQNEIDYNEGTQKINEYNYNYKISLEENKQKKIKADINKLNKEIKGMIEQIQQKDSFQNMKSKEVNKLNEEMIKFLSYLDN